MPAGPPQPPDRQAGAKAGGEVGEFAAVFNASPGFVGVASADRVSGPGTRFPNSKGDGHPAGDSGLRRRRGADRIARASESL